MGIIIQTKQRGKKCKYDINPKRTPQIGLNRTGAKCFNHSNSTVLILQKGPQTSKPKHEIYTLQFFFDEGWFPYDRRRSRIADRRSQRVLRSSAIVCDHMETHFCDRLRSFAILRSYGNQSSAICDRNVSHNNFNSDSNDSTLLL